jgi:hypothetical protein
MKSGSSSADSATASEEHLDTSDVNAAPSSGADTQDVDSEDAFVDQLTAALNGAKDQAPSSQQEPAKEASEDPKPTEAKAEDQAEEKHEDPSFSKSANDRIRALVTERNTARKEVESYQGKAKNFDDIQAYCQQNRLTAEDIDRTFALAASLKSDPKAFYESFKETWRQVELAVGKVLPADVQQQVDQGYTTHEAASELARLRAESERRQTLDAEYARESQFQAERREAADTQRAVMELEAGWKADPNYAVIAPFAESHYGTLMMAAQRQSPNGRVSTADAIRLANEAKAWAENQTKQFRTATPAIRPTLSSPRAPVATSEPESFEDAIFAAINKR